ncbi:MAG: hypothetical protein ABIQ07_01945, partial [Ginsengibacter sp.]
SWDENTKALAVTYNSSGTNSEKIQKAIAASGYDTQGFKATDKAYNSLMGCCKYERNTAMSNSKTVCKNPEACKDKACYKNGKCDENLCKDMAECKSTCCSKS